MQGPAWIGLLRRIPAAQQDTLFLVTTTGAEIVLQSIVRLEGDFVVLRGRMAGSTDAGRVIIVPYDQISYAGFSRKFTDPEVQALLGKPGVAVQLVESPQDNAGEEQAVLEEIASAEPLASLAEEAMSAGSQVQLATAAAVAAANEPPPAPPPPPAPKPSQPSKTMLLARLRSRLASKDSGSR
jgi:hypothetical protein